MYVYFSEYPILVGIAFGVLVTLALCIFFAVLMRRAGLSLKPLLWFIVFMALVAGPQAVVHVLDVVAFERQKGKGEGTSEVASSRAGSSLSAVAWERVFGPDADPALRVDPRPALHAAIGAATEAAMSFSANGSSAMAARFASPAAAGVARDAYAAFFQLTNVTGNESVGWTARRHGGSGEWTHVVTAANELYAWTGASRESVVASRERALGPMGAAGGASSGSSKRASAGKQRAHEARLVSDNLGRKILVPFIALNLIAVVLWFFRGIAWATRISPQPPAGAPVPAALLRQQLLGAFGEDSPIRTSADPGGAVTIDWNYANARWLDLMRLHRMKRTHRLVLDLDEAAHTVRVREFWSELDASAGVDGARLAWQGERGVQFYALEHQRVFGVQLDANGRPTGGLSSAYTFDLQAMKAPAIAAVTRAGWRWQPTLLSNAPSWLRWVTG